MQKPKVFVTRRILPAGMDLITAACQANIWEGELPPPRADLLQHVRGVDGILCMLSDRIDAEVLDAAGQSLKVISTYAVGVDNIDLAEAARRGIPVGHTPGVLTDATADFAFALLMAAARRVVEGDQQVRAGKWRTWQPSGLLGMDVYGSTLGIIGFGRIGQAVAKRAQGFGMRVLYYDQRAGEKQPAAAGQAQAVELDTLLAQADIISLHVPLNEQTSKMINAHTLARMKKGAVLINTARGGVVDQDALLDALSSGQLSAAAIDVSDPEPLPMDSPLLRLENLIITPHIASAGRQTRQRMALMAAENLLAGLRGEKLPHCANQVLLDQRG